MTIAADANCVASLPDYTTEATAADNCSVTLTQEPPMNTALLIGITAVTLTATDPAGNQATCTFDVIVEDTTNPTITCPPDQTISADAACGAFLEDYTTAATVADNSVTITQEPVSDTPLPIGTTTVTLTATDPEGNAATCSFDVIVEDKIEPQIFGCSPATVIEVTADESCEAVVYWDPISASDNCNFKLTSNYRPGDVFRVGTTSVVNTATDESGNETTCSFKIKVKDRTAPVVSGCITSPITATANSGSCYATVNWPEPTAVDNCEVSTSRSHKPGDPFPIGTTIVTYSFSDNSENVSTCAFNVIVEGVIQNDGPPVILDCPTDITAEADASGQVTVDWFAPTATASCGEAILTSSHEPGELFPVGITNVQYVATDFSGRTSTCSFDIIVSYEDLEFDIAKVITPDGDGINDEWVLSNIERFSDNKVVIVDRWGSVVFSASGYNNENVVWKGMNRNGTLVPTGTYFYTISVRFMTEVVEKAGFIEVVQ